MSQYWFYNFNQWFAGKLHLTHQIELTKTDERN